MSYVSQDVFDKMRDLYRRIPSVASIGYCPKCDEDTLCMKPKQMRLILWVSASHNRACLQCGWRSIHAPVKNKKLRARVFAADNSECVYCARTERLGIDHIIPQTRGGAAVFENLVTACHWCNAAKRDGRQQLTPRYGRYWDERAYE